MHIYIYIGSVGVSNTMLYRLIGVNCKHYIGYNIHFERFKHEKFTRIWTKK
jgi:hypothetical protein